MARGSGVDNAYMNLISKPEISFWVPIIITIVSVSLSFSTLQSNVRASEVKAEQIESSYNVDMVKLNAKMDKILQSLMDIGEDNINIKADLKSIDSNLEELNALHKRTNE